MIFSHMILEPLKRILVTLEVLTYIIHIFISIIPQYLRNWLLRIGIDFMQIKILAHYLGIRQKRFRGKQRHRNPVSFEMHSVNMVFQNPVLDNLKDISLFNIIGKIKLHRNLDAIPVQFPHHTPERLTRIAVRRIGSLGCKIKCLLKSPAVQPLSLLLSRIVRRQIRINMSDLVFYCERLVIHIRMPPLTFLILICRHQLYGIDTQFL